MIIWKGYGLLVAVYAIVGFVIGVLFSNAIETDHTWPVALSLSLAAAANYFTAKKLDSKSKILIDPETGQQVILKNSDSLFFIPMMYWTYIIAGLAVLLFLNPG
jgi:hypothetical protein